MLKLRPDEEVLLIDSEGKVLGRVMVASIRHQSGRESAVRLGLDFPRDVPITRRGPGDKEAQAK